MAAAPQYSYYPQPLQSFSYPPGPHNYFPEPHYHQPPIPSPPLKLIKFSGSDPNFWLLQAELYFLQHPWPLVSRFDFIALHLEGFALTWFELWRHQLDSWEKFREVFTFQFITCRFAQTGASRYGKSSTVSKKLQPMTAQAVESNATSMKKPQFATSIVLENPFRSHELVIPEMGLHSETAMVVGSESRSEEILEDEPEHVTNTEAQVEHAHVDEKDSSHRVDTWLVATKEVFQVNSLNRASQAERVPSVTQVISKPLLIAPNLFEKMHKSHDIDVYADSWPGTLEFMELKSGPFDVRSCVQHGLFNPTFDPGILHATSPQAYGNLLNGAFEDSMLSYLGPANNAIEHVSYFDQLLLPSSYDYKLMRMLPLKPELALSELHTMGKKLFGPNIIHLEHFYLAVFQSYSSTCAAGVDPYYNQYDSPDLEVYADRKLKLYPIATARRDEVVIKAELSAQGHPAAPSASLFSCTCDYTVGTNLGKHNITSSMGVEKCQPIKDTRTQGFLPSWSRLLHSERTKSMQHLMETIELTTCPPSPHYRDIMSNAFGELYGELVARVIVFCLTVLVELGLCNPDSKPHKIYYERFFQELEHKLHELEDKEKQVDSTYALDSLLFKFLAKPGLFIISFDPGICTHTPKLAYGALTTCVDGDFTISHLVFEELLEKEFWQKNNEAQFEQQVHDYVDFDPGIATVYSMLPYGYSSNGDMGVSSSCQGSSIPHAILGWFFDSCIWPTLSVNGLSDELLAAMFTSTKLGHLFDADSRPQTLEFLELTSDQIAARRHALHEFYPQLFDPGIINLEHLCQVVFQLLAAYPHRLPLGEQRKDEMKRSFREEWFTVTVQHLISWGEVLVSSEVRLIGGAFRLDIVDAFVWQSVIDSISILKWKQCSKQPSFLAQANPHPWQNSTLFQSWSTYKSRVKSDSPRFLLQASSLSSLEPHKLGEPHAITMALSSLDASICMGPPYLYFLIIFSDGSIHVGVLQHSLLLWQCHILVIIICGIPLLWKRSIKAPLAIGRGLGTYFFEFQLKILELQLDKSSLVRFKPEFTSPTLYSLLGFCSHSSTLLEWILIIAWIVYFSSLRTRMFSRGW